MAITHEEQKARWRKYNYKYRERRKPIKKAANLKSNYGITIEEYTTLVAQQDNKCAICGNEQANKALFVDHDHKSGKIRGLLCSNCNFALGLLKDSYILCLKMSEYLKGDN